MSFTPKIPSLLALAFSQAGMLIRDMGGGFFTVRCPWEKSHDSLSTGPAFVSLTEAPPNLGRLFCPCCKFKSGEEVLGALPSDAVVTACEMHTVQQQTKTKGEVKKGHG